MRSSCISHPENEPLIIIRKWQIDFCRGNACAAALLSFFSYWHDIRLEMSKKSKTENEIAEGHGDRGTQNTSLIQFHSAKELKDGILIYSEDAIRLGIALLVDLGCLKVFRNPNPRYHFDKTRYFLFNPEVCNFYIKGKSDMVQENPGRSCENPGLSLAYQTPITETTSEITNEIEKQDQNLLVERQALYPPQETQRTNIKNLEVKNTDQEGAMDLTPPLGPPRIRPTEASLLALARKKTERVKQKPDSRFVGCVKLLDWFWNNFDCNEGVKMPFSGAHGKCLNNFLAANRSLTLEGFKQCLENKIESEDHSPSEDPLRWIMYLLKYYAAPLDKYGRPIQEKNERN